MQKRKVLLVVGIAVAVALFAFLSGLANRLGVGQNLTLLTAALADRGPQVVVMEEMGLAARVPAGLSCAARFGMHCQSGGPRIAWSVCDVRVPGDPFARTPRTDTCHPDDQEEGIGDSGWSQDGVGRATVAGFAGGFVTWQPNGRANRGDGCSFRGYRKLPSGSWQLLHIEASDACNTGLLAIMLSTHATGEVRSPPLERARDRRR